jgi:uncharacterized protein YbjQ (UPF0145 family)
MSPASWSQHLPPVAAERIRRQAESHVAGSLLSAPAAAALAAADLEPVGEVMGCIVMHLGWSGAGCDYYGRNYGGGYQGGFGGGLGGGGFNSGGFSGAGLGGGSSYGGYGQTRVVTSGQSGNSRYGGAFGAYVNALYHAYDTALNRMVAEAFALNADGVVGVTLTWSPLDSGARELVALGTAVRHRRADLRRAASDWPWATQLTGEDVAAAALGGWTPLGFAIGLSIAIKHDDWQLSWQTGGSFTNTANMEVGGLTELLHQARSDARDQMTRRGKKFRGAAQIIVTQATVQSGEQECRNTEGRDHLAEAVFIGGVLAYHPDAHRRRPASSLSILPLRGEGRRNSATRNPTG